MTHGQRLELQAQERRIAEAQRAIAQVQTEQAQWLTELGRRVYCLQEVVARAEAVATAALANLTTGG